ncbi:glutathione S-transferase theta-1-like [Trichosurus vulpecula]|uniref:glutathione S-transferase theta-1-like n=1 Tax=Trichosurus vulpecula TaxID=9337 RepID=UPI00186B4435|nr:glutathione S-transferase theta-1-like [Trichosurus vulpecula]
MVLNLYLNLLSPSCRSLYIFAKLHFISFEMIPVDLMKAEHHSEEFVQMSPLMKVPVMKDEDFVLGESVAIMLYLCRRFRTPDHWYPNDAQMCACVDEYLAWQHLNLKKHCTKILWMKMMIPHFFKNTVPKEKLEEAMAELNHSLDLLKRKFLKDKPFLTGDRISLADLMALEDLVQAISADYNVFENRPWLRVWQKKVENIVGQDLCEEAHEPILKLKDAPTLTSDMVRKFDVTKGQLL